MAQRKDHIDALHRNQLHNWSFVFERQPKGLVITPDFWRLDGHLSHNECLRFHQLFTFEVQLISFVNIEKRRSFEFPRYLDLVNRVSLSGLHSGFCDPGDFVADITELGNRKNLAALIRDDCDLHDLPLSADSAAAKVELCWLTPAIGDRDEVHARPAGVYLNTRSRKVDFTARRD